MRSQVVGLVAALLLLPACAETQSDAGDAPASQTPSATSKPTPTHSSTPAEPDPSPTKSSGPVGTRVIVDDSEFGPMLYSAEGQAIYLFDLEDSAEPRCYDECADAWPPVLTSSEPAAGRGVRAGLLGTTTREDGTTQVTYRGHPLYFYAHEDRWQVLCHDFFDYGGTWFVVQRDGQAAP